MKYKLSLAEKRFLACQKAAQKHNRTVTLAEVERYVDELVDSISYASIDNGGFWDIAWSDQHVLQTIVEHPEEYLPLHKLLYRFDLGSRFSFWKMVFENRQIIPQKELRLLWYECLNDFTSMNYQRVTTRHGFEEYAANVTDPEMQKASVITDPLLIDNPIVIYRYCQVKKPGWRQLQYINGRKYQAHKIPDTMLQVICEDNVAAFLMHLDMASKKVSFNLLTEVLEQNAVGIFRNLLENKRISNNVITVSELCFCLVAQFQDEVSVPMLSVLDELHPGLVKGVTDEFGRNLLWYAVQNMRTGWFHPDCKLVPFLLEHGCDPQNKNQIGLPWQSILDIPSLDMMLKMMNRRYSATFSQRNIFDLKQTQPLAHIRMP